MIKSRIFMVCLPMVGVGLLGSACGGGGSSGTGGSSTTTTSGTGGSTTGTTTGTGGSTTSSTTGTGGSTTTTGAGGSTVGTGGMTAGTGGMTAGTGGAMMQPVCGDGSLDQGEQCDNGAQNANSADCTLACKNAACGDGFVHAGVEQCDNGAQNANAAACTLACKNAVCGDGLKGPGEACDDGNAIDADGCNTTCVTSGSLIWSKIYNSGGNGNEIWNGVAIDPSGNVIVSGTEPVAGQGLDIVTRKYDSSGNVLWTKTYQGSVANGNDAAQGVAADGAGNVIVIGYETTPAQSKNVWVRKYDPNGNTLWTQSINGNAGANFDDMGHAVVTSAAGDVYIAASLHAVAGQGYDAMVAKLNPASGAFVWIDTFNGPASQDDEAFALALDGMGHVIAAGVSRSATSYDVWVRKLNDNGNSKTIAWTSTFDGAAGGKDFARSVDIDSQGNAIVTGAETVAGHGLDMWIRKYSPAGATIWTKVYDDAFHNDDLAEGVSIDGSDNAVVVGYESTADGTTDLRITKYDPSGNVLWSQFYNGVGNGSDEASSVATDVNNDIYVAGFETLAGGGSSNALLRKLAP